MNKKIIFLVFLLGAVGIISGCVLSQQSSRPIQSNNSNDSYAGCTSKYTVACVDSNFNKIKENIPCQNNVDCAPENMAGYCQPDAPNLLKCIDAKYYCNPDGFCQGCNCQ